MGERYVDNHADRDKPSRKHLVCQAAEAHARIRGNLSPEDLALELRRELLRRKLKRDPHFGEGS